MRDRPIDLIISMVQDTARGLRNGAIRLPASVRRLVTAEALAVELEKFNALRLMPVLRQQDVAQERPYTLALVGLTNVGKSTILHALFGADIAVRGAGPTTPFPIWYRFGEAWKLDVAKIGAHIDRQGFGDSVALGAAIRDLVRVPDHGNSAVSWVRVSGPVEILNGGLEIADTPGFGAAQVGSQEGEHQARLDEFLQGRVHQIFLCVAAQDAWVIRPEEQRYFSRFGRACGDVVVNKWTGSEAEKAVYESQYQSLFPNARFHFTNARRAIRRSAAADADAPQGVDEDGIEQLRSRIESAKDTDSRLRACDTELCRAWQDLHDDLSQKYLIEQVPWHEFGYRRLRGGVPRSSCLQPLLRQPGDSP